MKCENDLMTTKNMEGSGRCLFWSVCPQEPRKLVLLPVKLQPAISVTWSRQDNHHTAMQNRYRSSYTTVTLAVLVNVWLSDCTPGNLYGWKMHTFHEWFWWNLEYKIST